MNTDYYRYLFYDSYQLEHFTMRYNYTAQPKNCQGPAVHMLNMTGFVVCMYVLVLLDYLVYFFLSLYFPNFLCHYLYYLRYITA